MCLVIAGNSGASHAPKAGEYSRLSHGSVGGSPLEAICSGGHTSSSGSLQGDEMVRQGWVCDHSNAPSSRLQGWPQQRYKVISDNPWARNHLGTFPKHWQGPFISRSGCAAGKPAAISSHGARSWRFRYHHHQGSLWNVLTTRRKVPDACEDTCT